MARFRQATFRGVLAGLTCLSTCSVLAQAATRHADPEEIVVTARKRNERLVAVPVVVTAVGASELKRRAVSSIDDIARIVPQLLVGPQGGSVQGGNIAIRGISGPDSNPFGDQAVSFNIDGVQIAKSTVRRMAQSDLDQVEVLKGPQALFFGKNSPAGIVSITTADPTDHLSAGISTGWEFYAHETRTEAYVSGPLLDGLTGRLSGYFSHMDGYLHDQTPTSSPYFNAARNPRSRDYSVRGTLKWVPNDRFDAKLKLNFAQTRNDGPAATTEFISCPAGDRGAILSDAQCSAGDQNVNAGSGPVVGSIPATLNHFGNGDNFQNQKQALFGLVMNYDLLPTLKVTSVTGYYNISLNQAQNYENDYDVLLPSTNVLQDSEFSQELRASTSLDGPLNFTGGLYYSNTRSTTGSITYLFDSQFDLLGPGFGGAATPGLVNNYFLKQDGHADSAYLQGIYKPIDKIEIDVGGRYSYEAKHLPLVEDGGGLTEGTLGTAELGPDTVIHPPVTRGHWTDFSPEVTVSYRPTDEMTYFASYKHGFLSGGFNSSSTDFVHNPDLSYNPETIKGFEVGAKSVLFDGALRLDGAAYSYNISDLQVTNFVNATSSIRNAGAVKIQGVEGDVNYRTPVDGLSLQGASAFNQGNYTSFPNAPCYNGETPAEGCNISPVNNPNNNPTQNLSHTMLVRAPKWNLSGGFNYQTPITTNLRVGLSSNITYSSSFLTDATSAPNGRQPDYALVDATLRLGPDSDRWELAVIGKNLTNKFYWVASTDVPFTGGGTGTSEGVLGDRFASVSRGREVMLRATYKFF